MDLSGRTLGQVGAGDTERSYGHICTTFDVMIAGPGNLGPYDDAIYANLGNFIRARFDCERPRLAPWKGPSNEAQWIVFE